MITEVGILKIIKNLRSQAKLYLGSKDGKNYDIVPLRTICKRLRRDQGFQNAMKDKKKSEAKVSEG